MLHVDKSPSAQCTSTSHPSHQTCRAARDTFLLVVALHSAFHGESLVSVVLYFYRFPLSNSLQLPADAVLILIPDQVMMTVTALLRPCDRANGYMRPGGARRALLTFLQYDGAPTCSTTTLRLVCFAGCALRELRPLLAPFGLALRADGSGEGVTPAGPVLCFSTSLGGPRPVVTIWKPAAVERAVLSGVFKEKNGLLGLVPVSVFREVLWPWVRHAARSTDALGKVVPDVLYFRDSAINALSLSDSSEGVPPNDQQMIVDDNFSESDGSSSGADDDELDDVDSDDDGFFDIDDDDEEVDSEEEEDAFLHQLAQAGAVHLP